MRAIAALFGLFLTAAATPPPEPVDYLFAPRIGASGLERLSITLRFRGDADGETEIELPNRWAGTGELYAAIRDLAVAGGTLASADDPAKRRIVHAPGAPLAVTYSIALSEADPGPNLEKARPILRPGWFFIHGEGVLVTPGGRNAAPARFHWGAGAARWRFGSNLDGLARRFTVDEVAQSIFTGGDDFRLIERRVGGRPLRIMIRGAWSFRDSAFADGLARAVAAENAYMERPAIPYFVAVAPLGQPAGLVSINGTGRTGGFALAATTNSGLDRLVPLLAHEYGHRWFGRELGPVPEPNAPEFWFTEGFNDFVAGQALVRSGFWSVSDYVDHLNEVLLRYASSPARTRPNDYLAEHFWEDEAAGQMPYDRGHLFALLLDGEGQGLRPALLRMASRPQGFPPAETEGARLARAHPPAAQGLAAMLRGEPIVLPEDLLATCGAMSWVEQPIYARGYTAEERDGVLTFVTVDEQSPAWAAGLRPGMRYVQRISFRAGDSSVPIVMRVADAAGERVLSWLPQGREIVRFQRLTPAPDAGPACRARLAGR